MTAVFTIKKSALKDVNAEEATYLFRGLLWCEARRVGLSPHNIVISLNTNVADGGVDATVHGSINVNSILIKGTTHYQLKAGHQFKPWQISALKKELFGKSTAKPNKKNLAPKIRACLNKRQRYVLVTFGYDLTPAQHSAAKKNLTKLLKACGYRVPSVEVLGQGQLVGQISLFPSLSLAFQDKTDLSFLTVDEWKKQADMAQTLQLSGEQENIVKTIRDELRGTTYRHIRVIGEPGLGKTRLAFEAVATEDIAPQVLYVPHAEDFQRSQLFNELLRKDAASNATLVIDECSERERASIWNAFRERKNIQLLTIDHGPEQSRDEAMLILDLPRLPDEQIRAILSSYIPKNIDPSHWVAWCEGSPRVAHAVGENLRSNPEDLLKAPATVPIWERFIAGYEPVESQSSQETLITLRHIALFAKFGFEDPVSHEGKFICQLVQRANPNITWQRFQEILSRLRQRRILQGKRTLFIVPKALHIHLWIGYWDNYGRGFSFVDFFSEVPSQLQNWFLQFFIYGHTSPVAADVIARILSPSGPFSDRGFLTSQAGTRFINYLSEADPGRTLNLLERSFGTWSKEELLRFDDGRQDVVRALEKIAIWKEYSTRGAKVLVKLALAENSNYGNNSTGILRSLLSTHPGLAATQAPPEDRFPIIEELLQSSNAEEIELGLSLCEQWLSTQGGLRTVGAEYQGLRLQLEFWKPRTWSELFDAWRLCWRHLWSVSRNWQAQQRQRANEILVDAGLELVNLKPLSGEILETLTKIADDEATNRRHFTHALIGKLRNRNDRLPRRVVSQLRALDKQITGGSFWGRFCRYVLNTNWDEDYRVNNNEVKELPAPSRRVKKLVGEIVKEPTLLGIYLAKIVRAEGHRLFEFGRLLALKINQEPVVMGVISEQLGADTSRNTQFIGGYFTGLRAANFDNWERLVSELLGTEITRQLGITVGLNSGRSESILRILLEMFLSGVIEASAFSGLGLESRKAKFPPDLVEKVLTALVNNGNEQPLQVAIDLAEHYFFDREYPRSCDGGILFRLITNAYFLKREKNEHHHYAWFEVTKEFRARFPNRDMDVFKVILSSGTDLGIRHGNYPAQVADGIARDHPDEAWSIISKNLESNDERGTWLEMWIGEKFSFDNDKNVGPITVFNPESVIAWAREDPAKRARIILRCLPKTLDEKSGGKLTRLFIESFGEGQLGNSLMGHFWTGGWSGPYSAYLAGKRNEARNWVSQVKSGKILEWLYRYIAYLNDLIAEAETTEEREF
jgi:hypothetical protein